MTVKSRVEKLENQAADLFPATDSAAEKYRAYIWSLEFVQDVNTKASELLQTMSEEHRALVLADFRRVEQWYESQAEAIEQGNYEAWSNHWRGYFPDLHILSSLFAEMITGAVDGYYLGPLTLPQEIARAWGERQGRGLLGLKASPGTQYDCEDCGYWLPAMSGTFAHCPLCGGVVSYYGYQWKRQLPDVCSRMQRDESGQVMLSHHHTMQVLGWLSEQGFLSRQEGDDERTGTDHRTAAGENE